MLKLMKNLQIRNLILHRTLPSILLIMFLTLASYTLPGCRILGRDKQSVAEKKQEEADKNAAAEYEKARKQHYKNQSKEARKRMKQTEKQASRYNKPKKRGLFAGTKCD